jgi:hypothetical protein
MPGLTITVGGTDITSYVDVSGILVEEVGTEVVATCRFHARDHSGALSLSTKEAVNIDDDGVTIFAGEVAQITDETEGVAKELLVICHDYNILLDETVIESDYFSPDADVSDAAILADLFSTYRSDVNAVTYVSTLDAAMEYVKFAGMTLREILDDLASRTGARYYIDYQKNLHWFSSETNNAAFSLSTSPNFSTSFPYGGFQRVRSAAQIADKVYVLGRWVSGWYPTGTPAYDGSTRHAVSRDQRIRTVQGVEDRGKAIYDAYNSERVTYRLWTERDGLRAGQSVTVVNATWGINAAFYIRRVRVEFIGADGETRRYHLELNDEGPDPSRSRRQQQLQISRIETEINSVGDAIFDSDAPAAPTALGAGNVTTGVSLDADGKQLVWAEITWASVSDSDLDHYDLQLSTAADFSSDLATRSHPADGDRRERFVGLVGNTTYYVRVRAVDWVGNYSAWDYGAGSPYSFTTAKDTTPPARVTGLTAGSSRTLVGLQWTANAEGDLRHYEIQRAPDSGGSPGAWTTQAYAALNFYIDQAFTDEEISGEDTFWYRVRAVDTSDNEGDWATAVDVELGQVDSDHIAASAITADKIAANAVVAGKIDAGAVTADTIAAGAVTATKINVSSLSAISADMGTLTAGEIRVGSGTVGVDFTGFRVMATYLGGYDDDTLQAGLRASDGAFVAASGAITMTETHMTVASSGEDDNFVRWTNADITTYTSAYGFANMQKTDPDGNTYGVFNVGVAHDSNNQSCISFWLNEVDIYVSKAGSARYVLLVNYDYVHIESVGLRLGTGTSDPTAGVQDGMIFYRTDTDTLRMRADGTWIDVGAFGGAHSDLTGVTASQHHTRYADSEALAAAETGASSDPGTNASLLKTNSSGEITLSHATFSSFTVTNAYVSNSIRINDRSADMASPSDGIYLYHRADTGINDIRIKFSDGEVRRVMTYYGPVIEAGNYMEISPYSTSGTSPSSPSGNNVRLYCVKASSGGGIGCYLKFSNGNTSTLGATVL